MQHSTPGYLPKKNENICPHEDLYANAYSRFIHNSQKLREKQISLNRMDEKLEFYSVKNNKQITLSHNSIDKSYE